MLKLIDNNVSLGTLKFGQPHTFYVAVQNPTASDIHITGIKVGCGRCTQAVIPTGVVKAGEVEQMKIIYTPNSTGYTPKTVTINDYLVFNFNATVVN